MDQLWCLYYVFDIKFKGINDWENIKKRTQWMISKTLPWDIAEMIANNCAYECLRKGCFEV